MASALYEAYKQADFEMINSGFASVECDSFDAAYAKYVQAEVAAKARFEAFVDSDKKADAEINATDTLSEEGIPAEDLLAYYEIAIRTYELS